MIISCTKLQLYNYHYLKVQISMLQQAFLDIKKRAPRLPKSRHVSWRWSNDITKLLHAADKVTVPAFLLVVNFISVSLYCIYLIARTVLEYGTDRPGCEQQLCHGRLKRHQSLALLDQHKYFYVVNILFLFILSTLF